MQEHTRIAALRGATARELGALQEGFARGMRGFWRAWLDMELRQSNNDSDPLLVAKTWTLIDDPVSTPLRSHAQFATILSAMNFPAR